MNKLLAGVTTSWNLGKIAQPLTGVDQSPYPFNIHTFPGDLFLSGYLWPLALSSWINCMQVILSSCGSHSCSILSRFRGGIHSVSFISAQATQTRPCSYCQTLPKKSLQHNEQASGNSILKSLFLKKIHCPTQTLTSLVPSTLLSTFLLISVLRASPTSVVVLLVLASYVKYFGSFFVSFSPYGLAWLYALKKQNKNKTEQRN